MFSRKQDNHGIYTSRTSPTSRQDDQIPVSRSDTTHSRSPTSGTFKRSGTIKSKTLNRSDTVSSRPPLVRVPSVRTRYMEMLLHLDEIPRMHNILASLLTWMVLAAYLVIPGTFTSFRNSDAFKNAEEDESNRIAQTIVYSVANIGLVYVSAALCFIGVLGCIGLWYRWRDNYLWLINRIFFPTFMNALAGILTSVVNIYTAQQGVWSVTAKVTAIVIGSCGGVSGLLFLVYNFWALRNVRKSHERELGLDMHEDETLIEKMKRKAQEPPQQPGSVV